MTKPTHEELTLANAIIERLFTNGAGAKARRLVIELHNGRDGGGWCEPAARDQIIEAIRAHNQKKSLTSATSPAS
jgi:hypothetical protein